MKRLLALLVIFYAQSLYGQSPIHITFDRDEVGTFPSGWMSRDQKNMATVYSVKAEAEKKFLRADAYDISVQISYQKKWTIRDYPILRWRWRAVIFPVGSNERIKNGADSALGVYVVLSGWPSVRAIKYIWSDTLPIGAEFDSPYSSGTKMIVVRSGRELAGIWLTEERNVLLDYDRFFGKEEKPPVAQGIALLTDSDDTHSHAAGDYADISITSLK